MIGKLIVFLLLCCPVLAGDRGAVACVEQVRTVERGYQKSVGTAIRLPDHPDGRSTWITAGHTVTRGKVKIDGLAGECVERSDDPDLALILAVPVEGEDWFVFDESTPETASVFGFGKSKGHYRRVYVSRKRAPGFEQYGDQLSGNCLSDYGDSGSPLYEYNRLYGVQWGAEKPGQETSVYFTPSREVKRWVEKVGYRYCWQWQVTPNCQNGQCPQPRVIEPQASRPVQPVVPTVDIRQLEERVGCLEEAYDSQSAELRDIAGLKLQVQELTRQIQQIEARKPVAGPPGPAGPRGEVGPQGPAGRAGTVTVILEENGKQLHKQPDVLSGSTVRVPIRRTETKSTGSN